MSEGATIAYLRGLSESNPLAAYQAISGGKFDKTLGAEKSDKLKSGLAQDAFMDIAQDDPEAAGVFLSQADIEPKQKMRLEKTLKTISADREAKVGAAVAQKTSEVLIAIARGEVNAASIEADDTLSEEQKAIARAAMTADADAMGEIARLTAPAKEGFESINSFSMTQSLSELEKQFADGEGNAESIKQYTQQLNAMATMATLANVNNKKNRGSGLNKAEYTAVMSKINELQSGAFDKADSMWSKPILTKPSAYDRIVSYVDDVGSNNVTKSQLLGYATAYAESSNINLFQKGDTKEIDKAVRPIIDAIVEKRKSGLGLSPSAPKTAKAIVGGKMEKTGEPEPDSMADRSVNPPKVRLQYNPKTGSLE
jgi:hypothetical protein